MNYTAMQNLATNLLTKFGNTQSCVLLHRENGVTSEHRGLCVSIVVYV